MADRTLPNWAEELRATYLRGESSVFVLHGNVFDLILYDDKLTPLSDFVSDVLLKSKSLIVQYNISTGIKIRKKEAKIDKLEDLVRSSDPEKAVETLENLLLTQDRVGLVVDYADMVAPRGETTFLSEADRKAVTRIHRWSLDRRFDNADNIVVLIAEQLTELNQKLVSNPKITSINVPLPDEDTRKILIRLLEPDAEERSVNRLAEMSAGLKNVQIRGILAPGEDAEEEVSERKAFILRLLGDSPAARERAEKLARIFVGQTHDEIKTLLRPEGAPPPVAPDQKDRWQDVLTVLKKRKREILEKECFGLIEFVEPTHDLSDVGGMEGVKRELMGIARNIREGHTRRVPMGLLFTGPMGSGKTFVAEAFARSSGLTAIKLKNFRSKWVGSTEGNLEKILGVVKAIGNILVIVDEGDRAFGNTSSDGDGDGGTSSRVIARLKEFMSDTTNRGRVLFVMMTNRPDKLDADIKRAGRLDRKIPFFYAQECDDVELVLEAQLRRQKVDSDLVFPRDRPKVSEKMLGYSNADIEAVTVLANDIAQNEGSRATALIFERAIGDYLPSRDVFMLEYMELLAVFESSSRSLLPKRYQQIPLSELQERLALLERKSL
ncbi:MAG: ATP-binding protein [Deltaproteobacteria bacterium]|nr:ATP-binding protein [Deltaproteobacteria bacterium]